MLPWLNKHVFPGGIHPPEHKAMSTGREIQTLAMPDTLYLPLRQHAGFPALLQQYGLIDYWDEYG